MRTLTRNQGSERRQEMDANLRRGTGSRVHPSSEDRAMRGNGWRMLVVALGAWWAALAGAAAANPGQWERHVSRHFAFTVVKPRGWVVQEGMRQRPAWWQ